MRHRPLAAVLWIASLWCAAPASGQEVLPRLDFSHPIVGGTFAAVVDRAPARADVRLFLERGDTRVELAVTVADASGCARVALEVPREFADQDARLVALVNGVETGRADVRFQHPSLLVTGVRQGVGHLLHLEVTDDLQEPFRLRRDTPLGRGVTPGGAVRDGRGTRSYVVADAARGILLVIPDDGGPPARIVLGHPDVRGIATTPDGTSVLVTSAGSVGDARLTVFDTRGEDPANPERATIPLEPFGADGGRVVTSADGFRAFVVLQGLLLHEVDLTRRRAGDLVAVGGPGQDERDRILDLRVVDGILLALTGREARVRYLTGLRIDRLNDFHLDGPARYDAFGQARALGTDSILLLDGNAGRISVLDAASLRRLRAVDVPAGAEALLLAPDRARAGGILLYGLAAGGSLVRLDLETLVAGKPVAFPFAARGLRPLPVAGRAAGIGWTFVEAEGDLYGLDPARDPPDAVRLPVELDVVAAVVAGG